MAGDHPDDAIYFGSDSFDALKSAELKRLNLEGDKDKLFGLALSGGGIRSASFALGLLQALYGFNVFGRFHYLSTVSGGGYIGGALTYLRHAFREFGPDWFPFGYLRRRDGATKVQPMATRAAAAPDGDPGNAMARQIVAYLRQHASYMTPSRVFGRPALVAGVLRCLLSTLLPYFAILTGVFGLLVWAGFFDQTEANNWLVPFAMPPAAEVPPPPACDPCAEPSRPVTPFFLAIWPANIGIGLMTLVALAFVASSIAAGIFHTADRSERTAESGYVGLIYFYAGSGEVLLLGLSLLGLSTLPWVHAYLNDLWAGAGGLPSSFAALFGMLGGAAALIGKLRGVLGGQKATSSPLRSIGMALAGVLFIYGILLLAYGASIDLLGAVSRNASGGAGNYTGAAIALGIGLIAACFVNINHATQHRIYRDRLMEVFCPDKTALEAGEWAPATRAQSSAGWLVHMNELRQPYHLINTCLVTTDSNKRRYRGRGGDNFILSPLFSGSDATGWVATPTAMATLSIATAVAVSGAALNAHSGPHGTGVLRNKAYAAVLSLLGLNLGYWARNPRKYANGAKPWFHMPTLLRPGLAALAGRKLNETGSYVQLSDGGHFENLAIYELIRRRVAFLWVSDAGQDGGFSFEDLSNAIERVRVDFGVNIRFRDSDYDLTHLIPNSIKSDLPADQNFYQRYELARRGYAIGTIQYPAGPDGKAVEGVIVYVKSTLTRGLPGDLYGYKARNADFPHQTTLDQFFDEEQFEAYRELGYRLASELFRDIEKARKATNTPSGTTGSPALDRVATLLGI